MRNEYYVYEYYILETNEVFYVGKGKGNRYKKGKRNKFCEDMKKTHNWGYRIVKDKMTEEESFKLEKELIQYYKNNTNYRLTNQTDGGEGTSGFKMPEEAKKKISIASKEKWKNKNFRDRQIYHRRYGIYQSREYRLKISQLTKGEKNGNYNNRWSQEQKNKLSQKRIEAGIAKGINNPKAIPIMCIETGELFEYIELAAYKYNIKNSSSISIALDKPNKTAYKLHFIKINNENKEYWMDKKNRVSYWIQCLKLSSKFSPIVCVETKEYYLSLKDLLSILPISEHCFRKLYLKKNKPYRGFTYMYAKDYLVAYGSDVIVKIM